MQAFNRTLSFNQFTIAMNASLRKISRSFPYIALQRSIPQTEATNLIKELCLAGSFRLARQVFDEMPSRDVVAWTAMISGYNSSSHYQDAWLTFCNMFTDGSAAPNEFTVSSVLAACRGLCSISAGTAVHAVAVRHGVQPFPYVENSLLDLYASCGSITDAEVVFRGMTDRTATTWTSMIAGYTRRGYGYRALLLFKQMIQEGGSSNEFTYSIVAHACGSIGEAVLARQLHAVVLKVGHGSNVIVGNSLLDMCSRAISPAEARKFFDEMDMKDIITWNSMIASLERDDSREALILFLDMVAQGVQPDSFTFSSVVAACANMGIMNCGQQVHGVLLKSGFEGNIQTANALVDMYAKCGCIPDSRKIFYHMVQKDLLTWTSLMIGYGTNGYGTEAMELFMQMIHQGIQPDHVVFLGLINACSHAGLVDEGLKFFNLMSNDYKICPGMEVYGSVIDLLGRAGRIKEAYELIRTMPYDPNESIWGSLLGACKIHRNVSIGSLAAKKILDIRPTAVDVYSLLRNIYAADGEWQGFAKILKLMKGTGIKKVAGISSIEIRDCLISLTSGDRSSPEVHLVYETLQMLVQHMVQAEDIFESDWL